MFDDTGRLEAIAVGDCNMSQDRIRHGCGGQQQGVGDTQSRIDHDQWPADSGARQGAPKTDHHIIMFLYGWTYHDQLSICDICASCCVAHVSFMWYVSCYWTIASTFTSFCRWFYRKFLSCCWHIWVLFNFECNTPYVLPQWELVGLDTRSGTFSNLDMLMGQFTGVSMELFRRLIIFWTEKNHPGEWYFVTHPICAHCRAASPKVIFSRNQHLHTYPHPPLEMPPGLHRMQQRKVWGPNRWPESRHFDQRKGWKIWVLLKPVDPFCE